MTIRLSSAMCNAVATDRGISSLISGGYIRVYSGTQPDSADHAATGEQLGFISSASTPDEPAQAGGDGSLHMELSPAFVGAITNTERWFFHGYFDGTPGWWRFYASPQDQGEYSEGQTRIDGAIGDAFYSFPTTIRDGQRIPLEHFLLIFPNQ